MNETLIKNDLSYLPNQIQSNLNIKKNYNWIGR